MSALTIGSSRSTQRALVLLFTLLGFLQNAFGQFPNLPEAPAELKAYGYPRGFLFLDNEAATYYLAEFRIYEGASVEHVIVSFHKGRDTEPLVATESVELKDPAGNPAPGRRVRPEAANHLNQVVLPALHRAHNGYSRFTEFKQFLYAKGRHFEHRAAFAPRGVPYEQPLASLAWAYGSGGQGFSASSYYARGVPVASLPTTIAEATQGRAPASANPNPIAAQHRTRDTHNAQISARDAAEAGAARAELEKGRRPGIVHKSSSFWEPFDALPQVRLVFDGAFEELTREFGADFVTYVDAYYKVCEDYLPRERVRRTVDLWNENRRGDKDNFRSHVVDMDPRFHARYVQYEGVHRVTREGRALAELLEKLKGRNPEEAFKAITNVVVETAKPGVQMAALLRKTTCGSATVKQLGENYLRAANGQPSLQRSGVVLAGANAESEPVTDADGMWLVQRRRAAALLSARAAGGAVLVRHGVEPFRVVAHADNDKLRAHDELHRLANRAMEGGNLVLRCVYLPAGARPGDRRLEDHYTFWYPLGPSTARAELLAADAAVGALYPGPVATECPATGAQANQLVLGSRAQRK